MKVQGTRLPTLPSALVQLAGVAATVPIANACKPMSQEQARSIDEKLEPGDVLLSSNKDVPAWNVLMRCLGSRYSHASIYVGQDQVVGSGPEGATRTHLFETGSHYALLKPHYGSPQDRQKAVDFALQAEADKVPYNWLGDDQAPGLNCTQLVAQSVAAGLPDFEAPTQNLLGHRFIPVDGFLYTPQLSVAERYDLNPRENLTGAVPVLGASLAGGAAGGLLARAFAQQGACGWVGVGLGAGIGYVVSSVAVLAQEMREQPPLYQMHWRTEQPS